MMHLVQDRLLDLLTSNPARYDNEEYDDDDDDNDATADAVIDNDDVDADDTEIKTR